MCRHLAYLGPPTPVGALLTQGPNSLRTQSWAPREMRGGGTINADGFGVAWWHHPDAASPDHGPGVIWHGGAAPDIRASAESAAVDDAAHVGGHTGTEPTRGPGPVTDDAAHGSGSRAGGASVDSAETASTAGDLVVSRYRNAAPIWTDPAVDEVLPQIHSTAVLAAIRSATVGMPVERSACAPFTHGRWAFSHNGAIPDWRRVLAEVATEFGSPPLLEAESLTDSAALWVILRGLLEGTGGLDEPGVGPDSESLADRGPYPHSGPSAGKSARAEESRRTGRPRPPGAGAGTGKSDAAPGRSESQGVASTVAFGSTVSVTSTSGAPPEIRAWGWASTAEGGDTAAGFAATGAGAAHGPGTAPGMTVSGSGAGAAAETGGGPAPSYESGRDAGASGMEPGEALRLVMGAVLRRSPKARLNLLLGDGVGVWATTWHHSLSVLETGAFVVVASEPFDDDPRWRPIGDRQLVSVRGGRVSVEPLDIEIGRAGS